MKSSQSNFNLRSPDAYLVCIYLIATVQIPKKKIVTQILISNLATTAYWLSIAWAGIDVNSQKSAKTFNYAFGKTITYITFIHWK